jgi:hypothetical protein
MIEPNLKLISDINGVPSPKMKRFFTKLTGKTLEPDIKVKGGAGLAIATVQLSVNAVEASGKKLDVNKVTLPPECFCEKYSESTGRALMSTLIDPKYAKGRPVWKLQSTTEKFKRGVKKGSLLNKHIEYEGVKRQAVSFKAPTLKAAETVKRNYGGL